MTEPEVSLITWVQDLGDGHRGIWQDGSAVSGAEDDRCKEAVARISRVTSSVSPEDHAGGVVSYVRRVRGQRTDVVVEIPRDTLDALGRGTMLTIHAAAPCTVVPSRFLDAIQEEIRAVRSRGVAAIDLEPETAQELLRTIEAVQAPGCLAAPFSRRRSE